jgi:hypothetical protein
MTTKEQLAERYDRLWAQAEEFVLAYFRSLLTETCAEDGKTRTVAEVPDLKQLSYAVGCLRRIQDGRRLAILSLESPRNDESRDNAGAELLKKELSRVLEELPENNADSPTPPDALPE